jgi:hypothetical protein
MSQAKDYRKHFPAPTDVIKIDKERSIIHHISLALIPGAPEALTKSVKFYGIPKENTEIKRLKDPEELARFTTTREEGNFYCYKTKSANVKTLRIFFGATDAKLMQKYYANKNTCKHYINSSSASNTHSSN